MSDRKERQIELEQLYKSEGGKEKIHALYHENVAGHVHNDDREPTAAEIFQSTVGGVEASSISTGVGSNPVG